MLHTESVAIHIVWTASKGDISIYPPQWLLSPLLMSIRYILTSETGQPLQWKYGKTPPPPTTTTRTTTFSESFCVRVHVHTIREEIDRSIAKDTSRCPAAAIMAISHAVGLQPSTYAYARVTCWYAHATRGVDLITLGTVSAPLFSYTPFVSGFISHYCVPLTPSLFLSLPPFLPYSLIPCSPSHPHPPHSLPPPPPPHTHCCWPSECIMLSPFERL